MGGSPIKEEAISSEGIPDLKLLPSKSLTPSDFHHLSASLIFKTCLTNFLFFLIESHKLLNRSSWSISLGWAELTPKNEEINLTGAPHKKYLIRQHL